MLNGCRSSQSSFLNATIGIWVCQRIIIRSTFGCKFSQSCFLNDLILNESTYCLNKHGLYLFLFNQTKIVCSQMPWNLWSKNISLVWCLSHFRYCFNKPLFLLVLSGYLLSVNRLLLISQLSQVLKQHISKNLFFLDVLKLFIIYTFAHPNTYVYNQQGISVSNQPLSQHSFCVPNYLNIYYLCIHLSHYPLSLYLHLSSCPWIQVEMKRQQESGQGIILYWPHHLEHR